MKANEFVKKYGWDVARDLATRNKTSIGYLSVEHHRLNQDELKTLVTAYELVESYGGLKSCHEKLYMLHELTENPEPIRDAVLLVESCT